MSKRITIESLTQLRKSFRENIQAILDGHEFDMTSIEVRDVQYPSISQHTLTSFYHQFETEPKNEFELAKILYESLPLDPQMASDNLYWVYFNLKYFFSYIKRRWIEHKDEDDEGKLSERFERFFLALKPSQNNLIKSPIAGLWWSVHLTINDDNPSDKYHYTKIFLSDRNLRDKNVGTYQFIRHQPTIFALLDFYNENKDASRDGKRIGSEAVAQQTSRALNQIGALTVLSFLTQEEIKEKLDRYKESILNRAQGVKEGKVKSREKTQKEESTDVPEQKIISAGSYAAEPTRKNIEKPNPKSVSTNNKRNGKWLRYFNLNDNGGYCVTSVPNNNYKYQVPIKEEFQQGHLLICYNEDGNINKVTVESLLRRNRLEYKNGLYAGQTLKRLLLIPNQAIIGIFYDYNGVRYFKAHLSSKFKNNNSTVGLQGYKTLYDHYDSGTIDYIMLPKDIEDSIDKLIFNSLTALGKSINNPHYREEFFVISKYAPEYFTGSGTGSLFD
ncbi:hypothetical protein EI546_03665 [Aequorivita sp. H23M31]|uniref:Uncharacterized protein n=1 Tax=Aequorivita ciconiae TaxID=2494375 RepID=A0A410G0V9_9FLAO|nr:DUF6339 family protein [Aequorivita sp. H23M31]QAA80881.1 hypothetical protein EI546_03665 [Aequorivita sp. H23M31]